ncbi:MAG TPA: DUF167 domain-containing protein [Actinomycetales bacterium]|nr:DUF167 domain-containing protein [Actinomycetales bacterium]
MRFSIRVRPGSSRTAVGGTHDDALVVRVTARAVDGAATQAALDAVAAALGVRRRQVALVSGATSRTKVVEVDADDDQVAAALESLRHA